MATRNYYIFLTKITYSRTSLLNSMSSSWLPWTTCHLFLWLFSEGTQSHQYTLVFFIHFFLHVFCEKIFGDKWLSSLVVRKLDSRLDGHKFNDSRPPFCQATTLGKLLTPMRLHADCSSLYSQFVIQSWAWAAHPYGTLQVNSAYHPPWDGKISISLKAEWK